MSWTVERVEWLTPHLVRVLFGGRLDGLAVEEGLDRRVRTGHADLLREERLASDLTRPSGWGAPRVEIVESV